MGKTLTEIAQQLKDANKKVQLIYGFNGMGKTRRHAQGGAEYGRREHRHVENRYAKLLHRPQSLRSLCVG